MTISELIERLEALKAEHGDLEVYTTDYGCCDHLEVQRTVHWEHGEAHALEINIR